MGFGFVFPGQGSQSVGMLAEWAGSSDAASLRETFTEAAGVLGYDLWGLISVGPAEQLNATEYTQPALLAAGVALWRLWRQRGGAEPQVVCGHSLGEFTALVAADALEFAEALALVRMRGQLMQAAVPGGRGAMAAILGLEDAAVVQVCRDNAEGEVLEAVNFNAPGQVVVAGERTAVQRAIEAARALGAKRAVVLPVSVPAHSSLMRPAAERLAERLGAVRWRAPRLTFVSAVDAQEHRDPGELPGLLTRQLASPVRWSDTVRALIARGFSPLIECGPGKVLTALNRRIGREGQLECLALEDSGSLEQALAAVACGDDNA